MNKLVVFVKQWLYTLVIRSININTSIKCLFEQLNDCINLQGGSRPFSYEIYSSLNNYIKNGDVMLENAFN